jgi:type III pantothenate kinase
MNAVVDFGNTRVKIGYFEARKFISVKRITYAERDIDVSDFKDIEYVIASSVLEKKIDFETLGFSSEKIVLLTADTPLPIGNMYESKHTLGYDRIAAAAGAFQLFPYKNTLIIDLGTAAKYDFVDASGSFQGGMIAPGRAMRFKALHTFTGKLPLIDETDTPLLIGKTTATCLASGVLRGMYAEINGIIEEYQKIGEIKVIITGGDSQYFENQLKYPTFAAPNLVLEGLNSILRYNVYKK